MSTRHVDVLVVGAGPTGLAIANALGLRGIEALVVEQDTGVAELPRAVSVDDGTMRFLQAHGLSERARAVTLPGTGTKYYGARGQLLSYARGPERERYGHAIKNPMDHAEFQQLLLDGARRFPTVEVRHRTRFLGLVQDAGGVTARIEPCDGGPAEDVRARYLVGADGGRSPVRIAVGQEPMEGSAFAERWLVLDTLNDPHDERYAMHHGDPRRPRVVIVGRGGRCRYEFLVHDHEEPRDDELLAFATELVAPYRALDPADVVRCTIYKFYALVARTFRVGNVFLAGDAAHMMPPFAGQGLNSGMRDATNLGWKLALAVEGRAGDALLDTYTSERRPHVAATVDLSVQQGAVMMTLSRARAARRDAAFALSRRVPALARFVGELRFQVPARYGEGLFVGGEPAGAAIVQPWVLHPDGALARLDDVLGTGFALLGVEVAPDALARLRDPLWDRLGAARLHVRLGDRLPARDIVGAVAVADLDGLLTEQLAVARGKIVLVRPDRFIAGTFAPAAESAFATTVTGLLGATATAADPASMEVA